MFVTIQCRDTEAPKTEMHLTAKKKKRTPSPPRNTIVFITSASICDFQGINSNIENAILDIALGKLSQMPVLTLGEPLQRVIFTQMKNHNI